MFLNIMFQDTDTVATKTLKLSLFFFFFLIFPFMSLCSHLLQCIKYICRTTIYVFFIISFYFILFLSLPPFLKHHPLTSCILFDPAIFPSLFLLYFDLLTI